MTESTKQKLKEITERWLDCSFLERFNRIGEEYIKQLETLKNLRTANIRGQK